MVRFAALILAFIVSQTAAAAVVYKGVGPDGSFMFSDEPFPGSQRVRILTQPSGAKTPSISRNASQRPASDATPTEPEELPYTEVSLIRPSNNAVFWSGNGDIPVEVSISPPLQRQLGHHLKVILDQRASGILQNSSSFDLRGVSRGSHTLQVQVVGKEGQVLASSPTIQFQLHRPSLLNPSRRPPPPVPELRR